ncbi:amino acid ABC transporter membrane protein 2, PAAT family [Desulfocicer vacuolatum DSM 3385]|uniref:Amino acid ABC transporter membrane protein 2, PAAT family n=1 Tax=Desulfocicer vacuolatum DSM 3385 TaxID=1121400 RepID=A0A1W2A178_9BACT|nr:ABC transporter permease subunit [Desulfocicer vacuolatum]SMC54400.1 amino acid ABC transporter membrane protein 2, PAAT family [Desulfocicer vacuolatum DSM 3385]
MMDFFNNVFSWLPELLAATPLTLILTLVAGIFGLVFGTLLALARLSNILILSVPANMFMFVMRGTPLLVQLYLIYYGLGQILPGTWVRHSVLWPYLRDGFTYAVIALSMNQAAYNGEVLRGALRSIPKGQIEASMAMGMTNLQILQRVRLPLAFRDCLPVLTSDIIILLKSTALVSTITVLELMGTARMIQRESLQIYEPLIACGLVYFAVVMVLTNIMRPVESRLTRFRKGNA